MWKRKDPSGHEDVRKCSGSFTQARTIQHYNKINTTKPEIIKVRRFYTKPYTKQKESSELANFVLIVQICDDVVTIFAM